MNSKQKKILLVGGGTGGHALPIFELYRAIEKDYDLKIVGSGSELEKKIFVGIDVWTIPTGKLRRYLSFKNVIDVVKILAGGIAAFFLLIKFRPNLVFSKGGQASVPITFWARVMRIPYFIHESDTVFGLANKLAFGGAKKVFVGFPVKSYSRQSKKMFFSGQLIDQSYFVESEKDYDFFKADKNKKTIFLTGGSQGSLILNRVFKECIAELREKYNLLQTSGNNKDNREEPGLFIRDYFPKEGEIDLMEKAVNLSDLVISRSGSTVAVLAAKKKPMILVPYKHSASDHQLKNAQVLEQADAAIVILEDQFGKELLLQKIDWVFNNAEKSAKMAQRAHDLIGKNGLELVIDQINREIGKD